MTGEAVLASLKVRANLVVLPAEGGPVARRAGDAGNADGRPRGGKVALLQHMLPWVVARL